VLRFLVDAPGQGALFSTMSLLNVEFAQYSYEAPNRQWKIALVHDLSVRGHVVEVADVAADYPERKIR
jgi:hypothetical protein